MDINKLLLTNYKKEVNIWQLVLMNKLDCNIDIPPKVQAVDKTALFSESDIPYSSSI